MSKLLIDESPLMFQPTLAAKIGVNEAIVLQQLHYLLNPKFNKNFKYGQHWVYNTYGEWVEKEFPFWSIDTIKRTFLSLENIGLVKSKRLGDHSRDRTKWYTIDYKNVSKLELVIGISGQNAPMEGEQGKMPSTIRAKCPLPSGQNAPMSKVQENYLEITQEKITRAREAATEAEDVEPAKVEPSIGLTTDCVCPESVLEEKIADEESKPKAVKPRSENPRVANQQKFEMFWLAYLLKVGKGAAFKAFVQAMKKTSLEAILEALEAQKAERAARERLGLWNPSWKHPSTWLNQECWNDAPKTADELQKEAEAKRVAQHPASQKKPSYHDRVQAANTAAGKIMREHYPDLVKHFPMFSSEVKPIDFDIPKLSKEIVINERWWEHNEI